MKGNNNMSKTVEELVALGFTELEAKRAFARKAKAAEKSETTIATAEKRLPKAQADLDHAVDRAQHWQGVAEAAQTKVDKYVAIISGEAADSE